MTKILIHKSIDVDLSKLKRKIRPNEIEGISAIMFNLGNAKKIFKLEKGDKIIIFLPKEGNKLKQIELVLTTLGFLNKGNSKLASVPKGEKVPME